MQLSKPRAGHVARTLGALAAGMFAAAGAHAQDSAAPDTSYLNQGYTDDSSSSDASGEPLSRADAAVLVYQEAGGRVRAIEPGFNVTLHGSDDHILSFGFVADTLTGASPNGAVPSDQTQTFLTPLILGNTSVTVTTASGGSTVIQVPPTPGQISQATTLGRQYTVAPNTLPVDPGFHDQRFAGNIGWSQPLGRWTKMSVGAGYSSEHDFRAITGNLGLSQDLNAHNTTVSLAANFEYDTSSPYGGTPTPFTPMSAQIKGPDDSRKIIDVVAGITEVMSRNWLLQLNYSYGRSNGYQNDPYRILSVVDPVSGEPASYLYESRPRSRVRQSVYLANKVDLGRNIFDLSARYFWDDWGIKSTTVDASDRIALSQAIYVEPHFRWYRQTAANFYRPYLLDGQSLPQYASSDTRLGKFTAMTFGMTLGFKVFDTSEFYVRGEYYEQKGDAHLAGAPGQLAGQNLFGGVKATSVMVGYSYGF